MTDKQIIIDGIDVSGCCQYMPRYMEDYDIDTLDYCRHHFKPCKDVDVKYCYYKQLKRKEQECNKLYIQLKADEEYHKEEENTLRKIIKNKEERNIELYKENNQLKGIIKKYEECNKYLVEENGKTYTKLEYKLLRTLTKIKELLLKTPTDSQMHCVNAKSVILQKISECEVENE